MPDYMLHEAQDAQPGEYLYAMGHVYRVEGDGIPRLVDYHQPEVPTTREGGRFAALTVLEQVAGLLQGWDAAWPPATPPNTEFVAGYYGGGTPHPWTDQEITDSLRKSTAQFFLPIFVRVPPTVRDPVVEANWFIDKVEAHGQPKGTLVALDYETAVDPWQERFDAQVVKRGYLMALYGSRSRVVQNKRPSGGYWTATWNNVPHLDTGATITQYGGDVTLGQPYDLNVAALATPFWNTGGDMPLTEADLPIIKRGVREVLRVSDNMDIIQFGQVNNDRAFNILAQRLEGLKTQATAASGKLDKIQATLDANLPVTVLLDPVALEAALVAALKGAITDEQVTAAVKAAIASTTVTLS